MKAGALEIRDATRSDRPEARLTCPEELVISLVTRAITLAEAGKQPKVKIDGDVKALARVLSAFQRAV